MPTNYIEKILRANIYDLAEETPLEELPSLSKRFNNQLLVKREDLQPVFSFKLRGAYNKIRSLSKEELAKGVIAASAGNHAQGVALAASYIGCKATIVMPKTTPEIKVLAVKNYGAKVVLHGDTYDEAYKHTKELVKKGSMTFIHPYDDPDVIAGQGTIAMEIMRQHTKELDAIFVPVGGGGLIAGIASYIKYLRPEIKVIGVEPDSAATLYSALDAGRRVTLKQVGIFADGVAVRQIGKEPFRISRKLVDEVILVTVDEICAAVKDLFDDTRAIAEPAGALAVAGMKSYIQKTSVSDQNMIAINSGANINFDRLRHIAERAELGEKREAILAVTIPEKAGSFRKFCRIIGKRLVTEFNYRFSDTKTAHIFVGLQLNGGENEREDVISLLEKKGYPVEDLTDNDTAKLHIRYMVGGHSSLVTNEKLYHFEFPERPGALMNFLNNMGGRWNISLFHYRNHGAAYGRTLVGIQIPPEDKKEFSVFLNELGYTWREESDNPAGKLFL